MKDALKKAMFGITLAVTAGSVIAMDLKNSDSTEVKISVEVPKMVSITKPDDMVVRFDGANHINLSQDFCIPSNIESPVKLAFSQVDGFKLTSTTKAGNGEHRQIPYAVTYKPTIAGDMPIIGGNGKSVSADNGRFIDAHGTQWLKSCEQNARVGSTVQVKIDKKDAQNVYADTYSATLKLTVSPE